MILKIKFCNYCLKVTCDYYKYCNYSLILLIIVEIHSFFYNDNFNPCFESIWLKITCYSVFQLHIITFLFDYVLFNCNRTIFCHWNNIGRPKFCNTIIACNAIILHCSRYIELLPTLVYSYCMRSTGFPVEFKWVFLTYTFI